MTRDSKLALILGFGLLLFIGVLISDHFAAGGDADAAGAPGSDLLAATPLSRGGERSVALRRLFTDDESPAFTAPIETPSGSSMSSSRGDDRASPSPAGVQGVAERGTPTGVVDDRGGVRRWLQDVRESFHGAQPAARTDTFASNDPFVPREVPSLTLESTPASVAERASEAPTHVVQPGETLWGLAERYYGDGSMHAALGRFNAGVLEADGALPKGAVIRVPSRGVLLRGDGSLAAGGVGGGNEGGVGAGRPRLSETRTYVVKRGDVLGRIAQRELGTSKRWREILELNADRLKRPEDLWVGMKLKLPVE